jgi:hypothetical protein
MAFASMLSGQARTAWLDMPAAVAVCAGLLRQAAPTEESVAATERAAAVLLDLARQRATMAQAVEACRAFLPTYEALLSSVTWAGLLREQASTAAASRQAPVA